MKSFPLTSGGTETMIDAIAVALHSALLRDPPDTEARLYTVAGAEKLSPPRWGGGGRLGFLTENVREVARILDSKCTNRMARNYGDFNE